MNETDIARLLLSIWVSYKNLIKSHQWQTQSWYFIDKSYYLKIFKDKNSYSNALLCEEFWPQIIFHDIYEANYFILFEQIHGQTVAETLPSLSKADQNIVFKIITQILKEIHEFGIKKNGIPLIHWDYHIGNIIISWDYFDIDSYRVIDRDKSSYWAYSLEYWVMIETIANPVSMVSEELEDIYSDIQLTEWWDIIQKYYPEFPWSDPEVFRNEWIKRAKKKFAFDDWKNLNAIEAWNRIMNFLDLHIPSIK